MAELQTSREELVKFRESVSLTLSQLKTEKVSSLFPVSIGIGYLYSSLFYVTKYHTSVITCYATYWTMKMTSVALYW